jgi:hypothetical protein
MKKDLFFIISLGIILTLIIPIFLRENGGGDFLAYWSAAHLFVNEGNPYSQAEMRQLQQQTSPDRFINNDGFINAWNPPWLILLLLPVGILPFSIAFPIWIFCNTFLIGLALLISWKLCVGDQRSWGILFVFLSGFLYVETISYLAIGQITSIVLLGIVLFIWFLDRDLDILAGVALLLTTIKPHISYFFLILVFIWIIQNRRWKVVIGFISVALISSVIFWVIIPRWLTDYISLLNNLPFNLLYTSTFSSLISDKFNISIFKYLPVLLIFLIKPLKQIIRREGWLTATNLALLVSIPLSPYGFNFDHVVLLPSLVQIIAWSSTNEIPRKYTYFIVVGLIVINLIIAKMLSINGLEYYWFFWIPIPLLGIYLLARKTRNAYRKATN